MEIHLNLKSKKNYGLKFNLKFLFFDRMCYCRYKTYKHLTDCTRKKKPFVIIIT